jgi:hypothetical protein
MAKTNKAGDRPDDKNPIKRIAEEEKAKKEVVPPEEKDDKNEEEEEEDDGDVKERRGTSCVLKDGSLIEMLYDTEESKSILAVYRDGKVTLEESVKINNSLSFAPLAPNQGILENGFIQFPSAVGECESNEQLYREIRSLVDKYVLLRPKFLSVVAAYVMMSWLYDRFQNIPYLRVLGMWGTGKSRVLQVAGNLCYKPVSAGGSMSMSALFRTLDVFRPTMVYDEAEFSVVESTEMRRVLRQGYSANTPVARSEPAANGKYYVQTYQVFGPKILASQAKFGDNALESRCLTEQMFPIAKSDRPVELPANFKEEVLALRNKLLMFRFKNWAITYPSENMLKAVKLPRLKQTGLAIVSVAKMIGQEPVNDIVEFLNEYEHVLSIEQADSVENDILICILELLRGDDRVRVSGKIRIGGDLAGAFNHAKYEEYSDRQTYENKSAFQVMKNPAYKVSPKKLGWHVRKMGLRVEQNRDGFYIPVFREYLNIQSLAKRYGLDSLYNLPDDPLGVRRVNPPAVQKRPDKEERKEAQEAKKVDELQDQRDVKVEEEAIKEAIGANPVPIGGYENISDDGDEVTLEDKLETNSSVEAENNGSSEKNYPEKSSGETNQIKGEVKESWEEDEKDTPSSS